MCFRTFSLALVIDIKVAKTNISFLTLETLNKISLLIVVEIYDFIYAFLFLLFVFDLDRVDTSGRIGGILRILGIPLVLILLLFLVFADLIGRLKILDGSGYRSFSSLGVIPTIYCSLSQDFVCGSMS